MSCVISDIEITYSDIEIHNAFGLVIGHVDRLHSHIFDINGTWEKEEHSQNGEQQAHND